MHRVTKRGAPARNDADFVDRVGVLAVSRDERMADFVIGHTPFFLFAQAAALPLGPGNDLFDGVLKYLVIYVTECCDAASGGLSPPLCKAGCHLKHG